MTEHKKPLTIRNARENNLKDISLKLEHDTFSVITGVSGSGKSSLAFDTIYSEGQRRYLETFSPYIRQFFDKLKRPQADAIDNVRPSLAIQQRTKILNSRSTVGSITGVNDYLKILWSNCSAPVCMTCGIHLRAWPAKDLAAHVTQQFELFPRATFYICAVLKRPKKLADFHAELRRLSTLGYSRIFLRQTSAVSSIDTAIDSNPHLGKESDIVIVIQRIRSAAVDATTLRESIEQSYSLADGSCTILKVPEDTPTAKNRPYLRIQQHESLNVKRTILWEERYTELPKCPMGNADSKIPRPGLFSYNHPYGACPECRGFGSILTLDLERCIPNPNLSIKENCIVCWATESTESERRDLQKFCATHNIPVDKPWNQLSEDQKNVILKSKTKQYWGLFPWFEWIESKSYKMHVRVFLTRYRKPVPCPQCNGARLQPAALSFKIAGKSLADIWDMPIDECLTWIRHTSQTILPPDKMSRHIKDIFQQIELRLSYLVDLGLSYLTLDRPARTLSGGETQRVSLATALGSDLLSTHFVLDEPSVGLHPRDSERLLSSIQTLHRRGNTVTVVEHDPSIIEGAEEIIEIGPGSGRSGGQIVYHGPQATWRGLNYTVPANILPKRLPTKKSERIFIHNATKRNLKDLSVSIPLNHFVCISGVSGSGKSTLIQEVLVKEYERFSLSLPLETKVDGFSLVRDVLVVDQSPLVKTPRANIATYTKIWEPIRGLLAATPQAKSSALTKSSFSFNVNAGRCTACEGNGFIREDMQFLSDVLVPCEVCLGKRFQESILSVQLNGKTVDELLHLTVDEALTFFSDSAAILNPLSYLVELGLGHLTLGHPLSELSGGEAQRLKLVQVLSQSKKGSLLIFDEPTTGLHIQDVFRLLRLFRSLRDIGHSILCVEHNLTLLHEADWVIDIGPEGGHGGGRLVTEGSPETVMKSGLGYTSQFLNDYDQHVTGIPKKRASHPVPTLPSPSNHQLTITGAREHNLKNIDLTVPLGKVVAFTGVSGSGKSTIARDIIFAEGQRRFLDCLSPYARQFIKDLKRPDIDVLTNALPSICVEQRTTRPGPLSTVGTMSEIYNFLRLLFVKVGIQHCTKHPEQAIASGNPEDIAAWIKDQASGTVRILAPIITKKKGAHRSEFERSVQSDITEVRVDGTFAKPSAFLEGLEKHKVHSIDFVTAKFSTRRTDVELIKLGVSQALGLGSGQVIIHTDTGEQLFSTSRSCPICHVGYLKPDPEDLSFHSKRGRCSTCEGTGTAPSGTPCKECAGSRVNAIGRSLSIQNQSIGVIAALSAAALDTFLKVIPLSGPKSIVAAPILSELYGRIETLISLGLHTLPLNRNSSSLSGGELQRLRLAAAIGSPLSGVLYLFDEPSAGLHPTDNALVLDQIQTLKNNGNTVVVIEHDPETILASDHVIEIGPGGGSKGGQVLFNGSKDEFSSSQAYSQLFAVHEPSPLYSRASTNDATLTISGSSRNITSLTTTIPLQSLVVIAGVSGAGKSSLVYDILYNTITQGSEPRAKQSWKSPHGAVSSSLPIDKVLDVDQSPIGSTSRSVPASYLKIWDEIRKLFAATIEAKSAGLDASFFSFNTGKGRCPECKGLGTIKLQMNFLPDSSIICEACNGDRFSDKCHHITYRGMTVSQVLSLTFEDALSLFQAHRKIHKTLSIACDLGLGYLSLGQDSSTLSGGEAQRIKLVQELSSRSSGHNLYILDEPSTGLHRSDVGRLIKVLNRLVEQGNSIIVIEHDLDILQAAHHIIELGPGSGPQGGTIIFEGAVQLLKEAETPWGRELGRR